MLLNGSEIFSSIQAAVTAASSGSEILVCNGTFNEYVLIEKNLTLSSLHGYEATTIDGSGQTLSPITISGASVTLTGFTLNNGTGTALVDDDGGSVTIGGGLAALNTPNLEINACAIANNTAQYGGGMAILAAGSLSITDTWVFYNEAETSGGGVYLDESDSVLQGVDITENNATYGGGLALVNQTTTIDDLDLSDNEATQDGGGLYVQALEYNTEITNSEVFRNEAGNTGGGLFLSAGRFITTDVDWGAASDTNSPNDIGGQVSITELSGNLDISAGN